MCNCKPGGDARPCYPSDLSDAAWAVIEPLMPARDPGKGGAPRRYGDRLVLNGGTWKPGDRLPWLVYLEEAYQAKAKAMKHALFLLLVRGQLARERHTYYVLPSVLGPAGEIDGRGRDKS